jgi:DNA-binding PadR family transcriptional regulator
MADKRTPRHADLNRSSPASFLPLPDLALHVLLALAEGDIHGWGIIKRIGELTERRTQPSSGSLYLAMARLEKQGLVTNAPRPSDDTDPRRRYYTLTSLGRRVLAAETARLSELMRHARGIGVGGAPSAGNARASTT